MRSFRIIIFCILTIASHLSANGKYKIALLEPRAGEGSTVVTGIEKAMVRGELRKAIVNMPGYEALTRADIDQMMQEQMFQRSGMVSTEQIRQLGEMSGADYICVSTLNKSNTEFYLEAYLIHLETGKMSNPASQYGELVDGKLSNMYPFCRALAEEMLSGNLGLQMSSKNTNISTSESTGKVESILSYTEKAVGVELRMVWVEGGEFTMGCTHEQKNCGDDELNTHNVTLDGFYMSIWEITQAQWKQIMGNNPSSHKGDNLPVETVSWNDAMEFCRQLSKISGRYYTLPTESQWEYAARGGINANPTTYAGDNNLDAVGWYSDNSGRSIHACGGKKANELGLYDMSGNVWEWCSDWYGKSYGDKSQNPSGPIGGQYRVNRGGSYSYMARGCRVSARNYYRSSEKSSSLGFRVVCIP